jgi:hypothetical protein
VSSLYDALYRSETGALLPSRSSQIMMLSVPPPRVDQHRAELGGTLRADMDMARIWSGYVTDMAQISREFGDFAVREWASACGLSGGLAPVN